LIGEEGGNEGAEDGDDELGLVGCGGVLNHLLDNICSVLLKRLLKSSSR
jgi:hypothetical protein